MSVLGIVKVTEGKALSGLLSRLSATSWSYAPATSLRLQEGTLLPQPQTLSEESIPTPSAQASSEVSCLYEVGPWGIGSTPTLSRGWAWQGLHMDLSQPLPQLRTLPLSLHHGG